MAFQPCPETAEIRIQAQMYGQTLEHVLHARISTDPDETELNAVKTAVNDWVTGPYRTDLPTVLVFNNITITDLNVVDGIQVTQDLTGVSGDSSDPIKTNQDTYCLKILTGHRGRSFRGRFYIMALTSGNYDTTNPNFIKSASSAAWVSKLEALRTLLEDAVHPLGVLSRYSKDVNPTPPHKRTTGLLTDSTSISVTDLIVDSQNRRLPGRGI